jgi:hypothetical protein
MVAAGESCNSFFLFKIDCYYVHGIFINKGSDRYEPRAWGISKEGELSSVGRFIKKNFICFDVFVSDNGLWFLIV